MCMENFCGIDPNTATHVSGSWINELTGPRVIVGPSFGFVLDSQQVNLRCIYASDAATDARDDNGCGPMSMDPQYGSIGYSKSNPVKRYLFKKGLEKFLKFNAADASDIPCEALLPIAWSLWQGTKGNLTFPNGLETMSNNYAPFLGRPICNATGDRLERKITFWLTMAAESGKPTAFQEMVETMLELAKVDSPNFLWNEIVMDLPARMRDIVQAVFFVPDSHDPSQLERAMMQSKLLGENVPVLVMNKEKATVGGDLFSCAPVMETSHGDGGSLLDTTRSQLPEIFRFNEPFAHLLTAMTTPDEQLIGNDEETML